MPTHGPDPLGPDTSQARGPGADHRPPRCCTHRTPQGSDLPTLHLKTSLGCSLCSALQILTFGANSAFAEAASSPGTRA